MALADYYLCDVCGGKCFYDANMSYGYVGAIAAICDTCSETHEIIVRKKDAAIDQAIAANKGEAE